MNIGNRIKEYRHQYNFSQEELADKVFVSRQTISNWENNKCYPDIESISLLCDIFHVSLNEFIKKDLEEMKKIVQKSEINNFNRLGTIYTIELLIMIFSVYPLLKYGRTIGIFIWILFVIMTLATAFMIEKFKKRYDIQTYKEIVEFCEGKSLTYEEKNQEIGKRPYQKVLLTITSAILATLILVGMQFILK